MKEEDLKLIINAIESGKCLAFLGAGACTTYKYKGKKGTGLPTGGELAKKLAEQCKYSNGNAYDLLKVAEQYLYEHNGDRMELEKVIRKEIQKGCIPRPIHTVLAQLKQIKIVITTNYDDLLEQEFPKYERKLIKDIYKLHNPTTGHFRYTTFLEDEDIVLHKMHGSIEVPGSIVITQSDYIYYLAHLHDVDRGMPEYFRKIMIPQCTLLFLGYSLEDWNFRVIWEGVLSGYAIQNPKKKAYALVKDPTDFQKEFWRDKNVRLFHQDLTEFSIQLAEHFNLEIPQLGIEKRLEGGNQ